MQYNPIQFVWFVLYTLYTSTAVKIDVYKMEASDWSASSYLHSLVPSAIEYMYFYELKDTRNQRSGAIGERR